MRIVTAVGWGKVAPFVTYAVVDMGWLSEPQREEV
jgi:hypothetical protein